LPSTINDDVITTVTNITMGLIHLPNLLVKVLIDN
jgi:hypothetical protein